MIRGNTRYIYLIDVSNARPMSPDAVRIVPVTEDVTVRETVVTALTDRTWAEQQAGRIMNDQQYQPLGYLDKGRIPSLDLIVSYYLGDSMNWQQWDVLNGLEYINGS